MTRSLKVVEKEIAELEKKLEPLRQERLKFQKKTLVRCQSHNDFIGAGCGRALEIGTLVYVQTYWYEDEYWASGEGAFVCPFCGFWNRLYDRQEIEDKSRLFLGEVDSHAQNHAHTIDQGDQKKFKELMLKSRELNRLPVIEIELPQ